MNHAEINDEVPLLYINRRSSTVVAKEKGKLVIREGGKIMSQAEEVKKIPTTETPKNIGTDSPGNLQNIVVQSGAAGDGAGSIDKIRDLIFGNQMQDYEKRFSRLEERMFKEMSSSKSESKKNLESLERFVTKEIENLKNQLNEEQNSRSEALKEVSRQLKDMSRSFEKKIDNLGEQFDDSSSDMRQQILDLSQSLRNEIRQRYEETSASIERVAQELQVNKMDRSALSGLLTEMAMRITNDRA